MTDERPHRDGQCDACGKYGILYRHEVTGIETFACTLCSGYHELECACPDCDGTGYMAMRPEDHRPHGCSRCDGTGIILIPRAQA